MPATANANPAVVSIRHWLVRMPFAEDILWGSGRRTGLTRLVVRIITDGGVEAGARRSACSTPSPPCWNVVLPIALGYRVADVEPLHRHVLGAGYYHHKRAAVMAIAAVEMAMWDALGKHGRACRCTRSGAGCTARAWRPRPMSSSRIRRR